MSGIEKPLDLPERAKQLIEEAERFLHETTDHQTRAVGKLGELAVGEKPITPVMPAYFGYHGH